MGAVFWPITSTIRAAVSGQRCCNWSSESSAPIGRKVSRFQREAEALGRLKHPAIVELYDFARERDGSLYMAMEYLGKALLSRVLKEQGRLRRRCGVAGFCKFWRRGGAPRRIIHRDLKPDNIVVLRDPELPDGSVRFDRVKVVDFGVARLKDDPATEAGGGARHAGLHGS